MDVSDSEGLGWDEQGGSIYRKSFVFVVALLVAAACGGDNGTGEGSSTTAADLLTTTTTSAQTATTGEVSNSGEGQGSELCEVIETSLEDNEEVDIFDPEAFEASSRQNIEDLEALESAIPSEVEDEFAVVLEANRAFFDLLEEYDWMIVSIPEDDPRMLALNSDEVLAASQAILDFCGVDLGFDSDPGEETGELDGLFPPGAGQVLSSEPILMVESSASYEDLVDHYEELLGQAPVNESEEDGFRSGTFLAQFEGDQVVIFIEETADGILVAISSG